HHPRRRRSRRRPLLLPLIPPRGRPPGGPDQPSGKDHLEQPAHRNRTGRRPHHRGRRHVHRDRHPQRGRPRRRGRPHPLRTARPDPGGDQGEGGRVFGQHRPVHPRPPRARRPRPGRGVAGRPQRLVPPPSGHRLRPLPGPHHPRVADARPGGHQPSPGPTPGGNRMGTLPLFDLPDPPQPRPAPAPVPTPAAKSGEPTEAAALRVAEAAAHAWHTSQQYGRAEVVLGALAAFTFIAPPPDQVDETTRLVASWDAPTTIEFVRDQWRRFLRSRPDLANPASPFLLTWAGSTTLHPSEEAAAHAAVTAALHAGLLS